jgi:hypothetical protein
MAIPFVGILVSLGGKLLMPILRGLLPGLFGKSTEQKLGEVETELSQRDEADDVRKRMQAVDKPSRDDAVDKLRGKGL